MTGSVFRPEQFKRAAELKAAHGTDPVSNYEIIEDDNTSASAIASNAVHQKLLAKISELKAQNNELRKFEESDWEKDLEIGRLRSIEIELRTQLSGVRALADRENYRQTDQTDEIIKLRLIVDRHETSLKAEKDDYLRKLSRLSDQSWEKDIEIKRLTSVIETLREQIEQQTEYRREHEGRLQRNDRDVQNLIERLSQTTHELNALKNVNAAQADSIADRMSASHVAALAARDAEIARLQILEGKLLADVKTIGDQNIEIASELRHLERSLFETQGKFDRAQEEISNLKSAHALELKAASDSHTAAVQKIKEDFEREKKAAIERHAAEIKAVSLEFARQQELDRAHAALELKRVGDREDVIRAELTRTQNEVARVEIRVSDLTVALNEAQARTSAEQINVARFKDESNVRQRQIDLANIEIENHKLNQTNLQTSLNAVLDEKRKLESQVDELLNRASYMNRDLVELRDRVKNEEQKTRDTQRNVDTAQSKLTAAEAIVDSARAHLTRTENDLQKSATALENESSKSARERTEAAARLAAAEDRYRQLEHQVRSVQEAKTAEINEMARINQELHSQVHSRQIEQSESEATIRVLQEQVREKSNRLSETSLKLESLQADMKVCVIEISASQTLLKAKADIVENLETALKTAREDADEKSQELEEKIDSLESELNQLRRHLSTRATGTEIESREVEKRAQSVQNRETHLRLYSAAISEHKAELVRHSKVLADEIQMAIKAHPLKDYLAATEFQLSKVEIQLKTTPTLSPERPHLESALRQMVEQRDFLRTIVAASERRLEEHAANVMAILKSPKLAPIPPLPPAGFSSGHSTPVDTLKDKEPRQTSGL